MCKLSCDSCPERQRLVMGWVDSHPMGGLNPPTSAGEGGVRTVNTHHGAGLIPAPRAGLSPTQWRAPGGRGVGGGMRTTDDATIQLRVTPTRPRYSYPGGGGGRPDHRRCHDIAICFLQFQSSKNSQNLSPSLKISQNLSKSLKIFQNLSKCLI